MYHTSWTLNQRSWHGTLFTGEESNTQENEDIFQTHVVIMKLNSNTSS